MPNTANNTTKQALTPRIERYVLTGLSLYVLYLLVIRILTPMGLQLDEAEQLATAQTLSWGYGSQPPLYTWLQRGIFEALGWNVLSISVFRFGLIGLALYGTLLAAKRLGLRGHSLAIGLFSLALLPQYSWTSINDLSHSLLVWAASIFTLLSYYSLTQNWSVKNASYLAIWVFVGMLSKHSYGLILVILLLHSFSTSIWQSIPKKPLPFIIVLFGAAAALPHYYWLFDNYPWSMNSTLHKAGFESEESGIFSLLSKLILFCIPLLLLLPLLKIGQWKTTSNSSLNVSLNVAFLRFNLIVAGLALVALFILVAIGFTTFRERWLIPFFPFVGIVAMTLVDWTSLKKWQLIIAYLWCALFLLLTLFLFTIRGFESSVTNHVNRFEKSVLSLSSSLAPNATIVSDDFHAAGLLKLYEPHRTVNLFSRTRPEELQRVLSQADAFIWSEDRKLKGLNPQEQEQYWNQRFTELNLTCALAKPQQYIETEETFYLSKVNCH